MIRYYALLTLLLGVVQGLFGQSQGDRVQTLPWSQVQASWHSIPKMRACVDMRPQLKQLDAMPLSQCRSSNAAVFSVLSALAMEHAFNSGDYVALSEGYTLWSLGAEQHKLGAQLSANPDFQALAFVWEAVDEYGVALEEEYPVSYATEQKRLFAPPPDVMAKALGRAADTGPIVFTGTNNTQLLDQIIQTLNGGHPVIVGLVFPDEAAMSHCSHLSDQSPSKATNVHAVVLVGYECPSADKASTTFIFRNAWGSKWGLSGYGLVDYTYLKQHLTAAWGALWEG